MAILLISLHPSSYRRPADMNEMADKAIAVMGMNYMNE